MNFHNAHKSYTYNQQKRKTSRQKLILLSHLQSEYDKNVLMILISKQYYYTVNYTIR